jgi:hypothetical protein
MTSTETSKTHFTTDPDAPGEQFEIRQTHPTGDYTPDPSKSLQLSPARQRLVDDIIALYSELADQPCKTRRTNNLTYSRLRADRRACEEIYPGLCLR